MREVPNLEESKNHMKSILIHWKPTFMNSSSSAAANEKESTDQMEGGTSTEDSAANVEDATSDEVVCATACLVTRWIMGVEGAHPGSIHDLCASLHWLKTCILPHTQIVQELLKDGVLRSTLYKLFYRVWDSCESTQEFLDLANQVMMNLSESLNLSKDISLNAVKELCLEPDDDADEMQKGGYYIQSAMLSQPRQFMTCTWKVIGIEWTTEYLGMSSLHIKML